MKQYSILLALFTTAQTSAYAQRLQIRQSMETAELREEPAQINVTIPSDGDVSWMLDAGVAYKIGNPVGPHPLISKLIAEYHRKTLTDKEQNNLQAGYGYLYRLTAAPPAQVNVFLEGDAEYVYDGIARRHSAAANGLFTIYRSATAGSNYLHWNAPKFFGHFSTFLSPHAGLQVQGVFKTPDESGDMNGIIVRPIFDVQGMLRYNRSTAATVPNPDVDRLLELSAKYVGRYDAINSTSENEGYTDLFTAAIRYFPFSSATRAKVSVGASYNHGSDPLKGLAKQSYWLISLNLSL